MLSVNRVFLQIRVILVPLLQNFQTAWGGLVVCAAGFGLGEAICEFSSDREIALGLGTEGYPAGNFSLEGLRRYEVKNRGLKKIVGRNARCGGEAVQCVLQVAVEAAIVQRRRCTQ